MGKHKRREIIAASDFRANTSRVLDDVRSGTPVILTRHGRAVAMLVPPDADAHDIVAARAALAEGGPNVSFDALKAELGL